MGKRELVKEREKYMDVTALYKKKMERYDTKLSTSAKTMNGISQFASCTSCQSSRNKQQSRNLFECSNCDINNQCDFHDDKQYYSHTQRFLDKNRN